MSATTATTTAATVVRLPVRLRDQATTTPGRFRLLSMGVAVLLAVGAIAGFASGSQMRSSTDRASTKTGPVLVASQQLVSNLAAADAAATAAFLSGRNEDPEQRRLYEQALGQATQQVAEAASLAGSDPAVRALLERISIGLTRYSGLVEAARALNRSGGPDASASLTSATEVARSLVTGDIQQLTTTAQASLAHDVDQRDRGYLAAVVLLTLALVLLVVSQLVLVQTTRRVLNLPLVLGTTLAIAALVLMVQTNSSSHAAMEQAQHKGYDSIVLTTNLSSAGFGAKAHETLAVITGSQSDRDAADADAKQVAERPVAEETIAAIRAGEAAGAPGGLLGRASTAADSPRERAAVANVAARWGRYEQTVLALRGASSTEARRIATGPANADFNGFNFSIQAILGQNRDQFLDGLGRAADRTNALPPVLLLLLIVAVLAALWGFQLRINDYR